MRARRGGIRGRSPGTIDGMPSRPAVFRLKAEATRTTWGAALLICVVALLTPACRGISPPAVTAAKAEDFHYSDPKTIAATGRAQLLEFVGPT